MSEENEGRNYNMRIWSQLSVTPPEFTHPSSVAQADGTVLTLVQSQYRPQKMTEVFGAVGDGWGWTVHERWREDWGSVMCAYASVSVWYKEEDGPRFETGIQVGGYRAGENVENIWKSAITNGIAKCAASIGLCADVYMGEFDAGTPVSQDGKESYPQRVVPGKAFDEKEPEKAKPEVKTEAKQESKPVVAPKAPEPPKQPDAEKQPVKEDPKPEAASAAPQTVMQPANPTKTSGRPTCPACKSETVGVGRNGKPNHCWDCNTNFDNSGNIIS